MPSGRVDDQDSRDQNADLEWFELHKSSVAPWYNGEQGNGVRSGRFEPAWRPDGTPYYRVRWEGSVVPLSALDVRRLEFLRYLIREGRVTEDAEQM